MQRAAGSARRLTADPVWRVVSHTPYLGRTMRTTAGLTAAVDTVARAAVPGLVTAADALYPGQDHPGGFGIDLGLVARAQEQLGRADTAVAEAVARVAVLPADGVLPPVVQARDQVLSQLDSVRGQVHDASLAWRPSCCRPCWAPTARDATSWRCRTTPRRGRPAACSVPSGSWRPTTVPYD
jgi:hypothetical protein